jgi:hypothetical protein
MCTYAQRKLEKEVHRKRMRLIMHDKLQIQFADAYAMGFLRTPWVLPKRDLRTFGYCWRGWPSVSLASS